MPSGETPITIPSKEQRAEWRRLAENTDMISAVGEYTPPEFLVLLDAVDTLEAKLEALLQVEGVRKVAKERGWLPPSSFPLDVPVFDPRQTGPPGYNPGGDLPGGYNPGGNR